MRWMTLIQILILFLGRTQEGEGSAVAYLSRLHDTGDLAGDSPVTSSWMILQVFIKDHSLSSGWWLGTWLDYDFPYIGNNDPN
jgi:hypothetical protein